MAEVKKADLKSMHISEDKLRQLKQESINCGWCLVIMLKPDGSDSG